MGITDKAQNTTQDLGGKAKESLGNLTGDDQMHAEGKADQAKAAVKDLGEKAKDAAEEVGDKLKDAAGKLKDALHHDHH